MNPVTDRQLRLMQIVDDAGESDARSIDLTMSSRHGPSQTTVRVELLERATAGLVEIDEGRGVGGTWSLTPLGRDQLDAGHQE